MTPSNCTCDQQRLAIKVILTMQFLETLYDLIRRVPAADCQKVFPDSCQEAMDRFEKILDKI